MKKKFFASTLLGLTLFAFASFAQAITYENYVQAIVIAADSLVAAQNNDGSFDWKNDNNPATSGSSNTQGATARGLIGAYKKTGDNKYLDAANKTADWLKDNSSGLYNKDIEFLFELSDAGGADYTAFARTDAVTYFNTKMTQTGAATGATAVYNRYRDAAWTTTVGDLNGAKYWMIGEWGDVARLLGDTEIYSGYTGTDMAIELGGLLASDLSAYKAKEATDSFFNLGLVGILEGLDAGIDSGGSYAETQDAVSVSRQLSCPV